MRYAFIWGLVSTFSLVLGGIIATMFTLSKRTIGVILGFGAGTLISAVSYELVVGSMKMGFGTFYPPMGFFVGAATFYFSDKLIEQLGAGKRLDLKASRNSNLVIPMVLAIILDGIPESIVLGLGIYQDGTVRTAMLVAIFISNLPEAIAGTSGMKKSHWNWKKIILLWVLISLCCALATIAGFAVFSGVSNHWISFIQAFAGGAILMMLANSMIPEAYEHGGKLVGAFTILGFFISVCLIVQENIQ
jgi:ZIP family zinc transporter